MERQTQVNIRLSLEEKAQILKRAKQANQGLSDYMRQRALEPDLKEYAEAKKMPKLDPPDVKAAVEESWLPKKAVEEAGQEVLQAQALADEVRKLKGPPHGMTTPAATREAKKRLGL